MFQIRFHGRGGQGVVTAAEMLSVAAFMEGRHAQAFPSFGSERMGAPVVSFCRIDDKEIRLREPILEPDALIVQDPTLFKVIDVFQGLKPNGYLLVNSNRTLSELHLDKIVAQLPKGHALTVPASELRSSTSGVRCRTRRCSAPLPRSPASFVSKSVERRDRRDFPGKRSAHANIAAATAAYDAVAARRRRRA